MKYLNKLKIFRKSPWKWAALGLVATFLTGAAILTNAGSGAPAAGTRLVSPPLEEKPVQNQGENDRKRIPAAGQLPQVGQLLSRPREEVEQLLGKSSWYGPYTKGWRLMDSGRVVEASQGKYAFLGDGEPVWISGHLVIVDYIDGLSRRVEISLPASEEYQAWASPRDSARVLNYFGLFLPEDKRPEARFDYPDSITYTDLDGSWRVIVSGRAADGEDRGWIFLKVTAEKNYRSSSWY